MSSSSVTSTPKLAQQVFNTTELLEHILSFLPMPQLLGKSRVTRDWNTVIENSPALQKKLFLRHNGSQAEVVSPDHWFPKPEGWSREYLANVPVYTTQIELNPFVDWKNQAKLHITHELKVVYPKRSDRSLAGLGVVLGKYSSSYIRHRFGRSFQREQFDSSWRKMYITTPPITDVVIHVPTTVAAWDATVSPDEHIRVNVHSEHGITLGMLRDKVEETLKKFRMKDGRSLSQKRKNGPLREEDFVRGWGNVAQVMFLVQPTLSKPTEDTADSLSE